MLQANLNIVIESYTYFLYYLYSLCRFFCLWWPDHAAICCTAPATNHFGKLKGGNIITELKQRVKFFQTFSYVSLGSISLDSKWGKLTVIHLQACLRICFSQVQEMLVARKTRTREALALMWCAGQLPHENLSQGLAGLLSRQITSETNFNFWRLQCSIYMYLSQQQ